MIVRELEAAVFDRDTVHRTTLCRSRGLRCAAIRDKAGARRVPRHGRLGSSVSSALARVRVMRAPPSAEDPGRRA